MCRSWFIKDSRSQFQKNDSEAKKKYNYIFFLFVVAYFIIVSINYHRLNELISHDEIIGYGNSLSALTTEHSSRYAESSIVNNDWDRRLYRNNAFKSTLEHIEALNLKILLDSLDGNLRLYGSFGHDFFFSDTIEISDLIKHLMYYAITSPFANYTICVYTGRYETDKCAGTDYSYKSRSVDYIDSSSYELPPDKFRLMFSNPRKNRISNSRFWRKVWSNQDSIFIDVFIRIDFRLIHPEISVLCSTHGREAIIQSYLYDYWKGIAAPDSTIERYYLAMYINQGILNAWCREKMLCSSDTIPIN